jgi:autotransporter-associated beta strand protein
MNLLTKAPANASQLHIRFIPASSESNPRLVRNTFLQTILAVAISILAPMVAHAGSATWDLNPTSGDWNTAANWTPATVPNGAADTATFALSNTTGVSISADTEVNGITFTPAATNPYLITPSEFTFLALSGTGITNNSGIEHGLELLFSTLQFSNSSTAGNANIRNGPGGGTFFSDTSTAGSATILNFTGLTAFLDSSTAGSADIFMDDLGITEFSNTSTAGSATIFGYGAILFDQSSKGGTARIEVFQGFGLIGFLDIRGHNAPGVMIGSIEGGEDIGLGGGNVFLGANNLTVGDNNLSTTFSGVIEDEGFGGSLTKIGKGTLDLTGDNTYTGLTNINGGVLQVDGSTSSNTFINHKGSLAGSGTVNGNVTNYSGEVSPGDPLAMPGVLTVSNNYMQTPSATLTIQIGGADPGQVSVLNVLGNANLNGSLDPELMNGFVPDVGQSFTFLGYASVTGSFSHIRNHVFDNGRKRWALVYQSTGAALVVVNNGRSKLSMKSSRDGSSVILKPNQSATRTEMEAHQRLDGHLADFKEP